MQGISLRGHMVYSYDELGRLTEPSPFNHLQASVVFMVLERTRNLPALDRPKSQGIRALFDPLASACLDWLDSGKWRFDVDRRFVTGELSKESDFNQRGAQAALAALAVIEGDDRELVRARETLMKTRPVGDFSYASESEVLFLTSSPIARLHEQRDVVYGWVSQLCRRDEIEEEFLPLVALAIHLCRETGSDFRAWLTAHVREFDTDYCGELGDLGDIDDDNWRSSDEPRVEAGQFTLQATRKDQPGITIDADVEGHGGRVFACLPEVLDKTLHEAPTLLMRVLANERPANVIEHIRSKKDLGELLGHDDSRITIKLNLSRDLSIENEDLEIYRARLRIQIEWLRTLFPRVRAEGDIVVTRAS
jgi:hypothetical protein